MFNKTNIYRHLSYASYTLFLILYLWKIYLFNQYTNVIFINTPWYQGTYVISLGCLILLSFWVFLLSGTFRFLSLIGINLAVSFVIFADLLYFRYFKDFITIPVILQSGQVSSLGDSVTNLIENTDIYFVADFVFWLPIGIFLLIRLGMNKLSSSNVPSRASRLRTTAVVFCIGLLLTAYPLHVASTTWAKELLQRNWWNMSVYNATGLLGFHGYDAYKYTGEHLVNKNISDEDAEEAKMWFEEHRAKQVKDLTLFGAAQGSNVIVVQAEAFQNFAIGRKINGEEITPNLNVLLKESMYFNHFYHQTGQGRTSDADFLTHCSLHPLPTGSVFIRYPDNTYDCLPQTLKDNGYQTAAFHAYEPSFWNRYHVYPNIGIDRFYSVKDYSINEIIGWSLSDESFFKQSIDKMNTLQTPYYSYLITLSSHHPYSIQEYYKKLNVGSLKDKMLGNYIQSLHYVDKALGNLVERLKADGLWDTSIFVFYGDHDNAIVDYKGMDYFYGKEQSSLEREQARNQVPLIIHLPHGQGAGLYEQAAGQMDLSPAIMHLLGIPAKDKYIMGSNLLQNDGHNVVLRNGSFTDSTVYYIASLDHVFEHGECYDLSDQQKTNLNACRNQFNSANKELEISDRVILYNLIKEWKP
ncbi:MAG TPA: LTA synthase family protein [Bacilli bacterium]